jgi:hypothetical protein
MGAAMHNFFTIEVEAEMRRQESERAAAADARAALACSSKGIRGWLSRFAGSQASLAAVTSPSAPVGALLELPRVPRPVAC